MAWTPKVPTQEQLLAYFWNHTARRDTNECWLWTGAPDDHGYGRVDCGSVQTRAHRVAWTLLVDDEVPDVVDHHCHNVDTSCQGGNTCPHRRCVNPTHLRASNVLDNLAAGRSGGAIKAVRRNHCPAGHPLSGDNLHVRADGRGRDCKKCRAAAEARRRERVGNTCEVCPTRISPRARRCRDHRLTRWSER